MAIEIKCNCGLDYRLDDSRAGEVFRCRLCGAEIQLPHSVGRASPNSPLSRTRQQNATAQNGVENEAEAIDWSQYSLDSASEATNQPGQRGESNAETVKQDGKALAAAGIRRKGEPERSDNAVPRVPPLAWWALRAVMWLICVGFIFAPWLKLTLYNPDTRQREAEHITGWTMAMSVVDELRYTGSIHPAAAAPILESYADPTLNDQDTLRVVLGGRLMAFGAAVFLAGILATPLAGLLVLLTGTRAMSLPFAVCLLALSAFTAGWFTAMSAAPMQALMDAMRAQGCQMGISDWIYVMLPILAALSLRAGIKPDYKLLQAIQWCRQRNESGS